MIKQSALVVSLLAVSSTVALAGGTVRQAPSEAEATPAPAPAPVIVPAPVVPYQPANYIGIGIGASKFRGDCVTGSNATGYKIFAGHLLTPHIGVELSYVDLGRSTDDLTCIVARNGTGSASGGGGGGGGGNGGGGNGGGGNGGGGNGGGGNGGGGNGSGSTSSGSGSGFGSGSGTAGSDGVVAGGTSGGSSSVTGNGQANGNGIGTGSAANGVGNSGIGGTDNSKGGGNTTITGLDPHVRGIGLALVAGMPFYNNAASIYVKGGAFFYHATDDFSGSNNGTSPFYGIGAQYNFSLRSAVRVEYEQYHNVGTDTIGKQNVDLASISYVYRF
jgi:hypothetical protein